ncbi:arsenic resistance N-acetyltransferase ArsN2 [Pseudoduganella sp. SL102]|uniref:arsenic resistance N-acetyltransferase ArsN2 n=1 Tax=Pseudoduganella sp. SL102 TaxID=2995154 RepID=UPI00248B46AD|nr:arsenic resistance N-acetyltransferase ArsN2 [Pseudoduganella sp. SL102]WBS00026.1 arsenic resistance N-acetyltransferase ArsN2 [Pseudoduganella sp. SL102]
MKKFVTYRSATAQDWPPIEELLGAARLPLDGARDNLEDFLIGESGGAICCVGGYERYGEVALLRSVAVAHGYRGQGIGEHLLEAIRERARAQGVRHLYLLTTTAADFFSRHGFTVVGRDTAPAELHTSHQFQGVCPASATCLAASLFIEPGLR